MGKEYIGGVSFTDDTAQVAVLEVGGSEIKVRYLEDIKKGSSDDLWFLQGVFEMKEKRVRKVKKVKKVSVAVDNASLFLHSFPMDTSLTKAEQNEHVDWELSNYLSEYNPKDYVNDVHILRTKAREHVCHVLTISVKKSLIYGIQNMLSENKFELHIIDTNHFGAQYALITNYPEVKTKVVALVAVAHHRVDAGLLHSGRLIAYRYGLMTNRDDAVKLLQEVLKDTTISDLFIYGTAVSTEVVGAIENSLNIKVTKLNPFQRLKIASSFRDFERFLGREHRFAASVGCALRKE
ncbi:MAG: hypothetical protein HY707_01520 [Ignavibacteriae bacterium]|nr:hypothetical protein [Ignavibacteriota bacterium]